MAATKASTRKQRKRKMSDLAETTAGQFVLKLWHELPAWQREGNEFIETGYRSASGSYRESLMSWRYIHNETVNIFSHLFGAVLFSILPFIVYRELSPRYESATAADVAVFSAYLFGVAVCFTCSTMYHTIMNHSPEVFAWGIQLDFQGVLILMLGATIPIIYYGFICAPRLQVVYWALISTSATACSLFTFTTLFRDQSVYVRPIRAALFGGFALSAIIPIVHSVFLWGLAAQNYRISLWYIFGVMCFNTTGAVAYAVKFPERWFPRRFDIFGGSHQIMHVMVLCAAVVHVSGLIRDFDNLHKAPLRCS